MKPRKRRSMRANPAQWLLLAFVNEGGREKRLHFDGTKFTVKGRAKRFPDSRAAANLGRKLREKFPVLKKVRLRVEPLKVPRISKYQTNPSGFRRAVDAYAAELDKADNLLNDFSGHRAREVVAVKEPPFKTGLVVGEVLGVMYSAVRDGTKINYCHEFRAKSRPLLAANSDGSRIQFVGGRYEFTDRGIVDK